MLFPKWLNEIPLSCLAAVLIVTGFKLAKPSLFRQMWREGAIQFLPFVVTVVAILFTDLLIGILIGLGVSILFILRSNLRRPIRQIMERHIGDEVLRIELADQVSFLNRAALLNVFDAVPRGGHVLVDARRTDYIDADVLDVIHEYVHEVAPARGVEVSMVGLREHYKPLEADAKQALVDDLYRRHIRRTIVAIRSKSAIIDHLSREGCIDIVGAMYDVHSGKVDFMD